MKFTISLVALTILLLSPVSAATKTLTILGDQKIKASFKGDMPKPVAAQGITTDISGFGIEDGKLLRGVGFSYKGKSTVVRVTVEDVSGKTAVLIVNDTAPQLLRGAWRFISKPVAIGKTSTPWVFSSGDSTIIYCFTIHFSENDQPVVIYQPAVFKQSAKEIFAQFADDKGQ